MTIAASVQDCLVREGVRYEMIAHERTGDSNHSAQTAHIPGDRLAKCVMLEDDKGFLMAVVPASHKVDLGAVRRQLNRELGLVTDRALVELFKDCEQGALPPLGLAYGIDTILDECLVDAPDIYFEAGDHQSLVHVSGSAFLKLMGNAPRSQISYHV
jgi:Ala-tRNA(Pro) deacylase